MKRLYHIFDYFKTAFHINRENKELYQPQIILIIMKLLMIISMGVGLYLWLGSEELLKLLTGEVKIIYYLSKFLFVGIGLLIIAMIYIILSRIVEAGLYNLYKKSVMVGVIEKKDFREGVRKYFLSFLFGDLLIFAAWIVALPLYFISGFLTLTIGFAVIPMVINVFLTMWKVSLVMNDSTLFVALGDSFKFAKRHFFPLSVLQLIHWSFMNLGGGGSGSLGNSSRWTQGSDKVQNLDKIPTPINPDIFTGPRGILEDVQRIPSGVLSGRQDIVESAIRVIRIIIAVFIPVITIATAVSALIKMVFEVFFTLAIFIVYKNDFEQPQGLVESEVLS